MKKILVMVVAAMMATVNVNAQDELKNEIGVFGGIESVSNILSIYSSIFSAAVGDQSDFWGPIGVEYYYHFKPGLALGAVAAYAGCKAEDKNTGSDDFNETFITVMPSVKFNWLRKKNFGMYSALSAGMMIAHVSTGDGVKSTNSDSDSETIAAFMFQATALGLEFGSEQFRGFVEAGLGEKGLLCAGLRYKF